MSLSERPCGAEQSRTRRALRAPAGVLQGLISEYGGQRVAGTVIDFYIFE